MDLIKNLKHHHWILSAFYCSAYKEKTGTLPTVKYLSCKCQICLLLDNILILNQHDYDILKEIKF